MHHLRVDLDSSHQIQKQVYSSLTSSLVITKLICKDTRSSLTHFLVYISVWCNTRHCRTHNTPIWLRCTHKTFTMFSTSWRLEIRPAQRWLHSHLGIKLHQSWELMVICRYSTSQALLLVLIFLTLPTWFSLLLDTIRQKCPLDISNWHESSRKTYSRFWCYLICMISRWSAQSSYFGD